MISDKVVPEPETKRVLIVMARGDRCALPLEHVVETMRPLPIEPFANAGPHVLGISIVRGVPLPVLDLGRLLGRDSPRPAAATARFVTLRTGARQVALAVESVVGIGTLDAHILHALPPLLGALPAATVTALGVLDRALVAVLDASRVVHDDGWAQRLDAS